MIFFTLFSFLYFSNSVYANQLTFFKGSVKKTKLICSVVSFNYTNKPDKYKTKWIIKNQKFTHVLFEKSAKLGGIPTVFFVKFFLLNKAMQIYILKKCKGWGGSNYILGNKFKFYFGKKTGNFFIY